MGGGLVRCVAEVHYGGAGTDGRAGFQTWWPGQTSILGKDITRFMRALAGRPCVSPPASSRHARFRPGVVYRQNEDTGVLEKFSKTLGQRLEPMDGQLQVQRWRHSATYLPAQMYLSGRTASWLASSSRTPYNAEPGQKPRQFQAGW